MTCQNLTLTMSSLTWESTARRCFSTWNTWCWRDRRRYNKRVKLSAVDDKCDFLVLVLTSVGSVEVSLSNTQTIRGISLQYQFSKVQNCVVIDTFTWTATVSLLTTV